jgi:hypothetical protein
LRFPTHKYTCYMFRQSNHSRICRYKIISWVYKFWSDFTLFLISASCHTSNWCKKSFPRHPIHTNSQSVPAACSKISHIVTSSMFALIISSPIDGSKESEMSGVYGRNVSHVLMWTLKGNKDLEVLSVDLCVILKRSSRSIIEMLILKGICAHGSERSAIIKFRKVLVLSWKISAPRSLVSYLVG